MDHVIETTPKPESDVDSGLSLRIDRQLAALRHDYQVGQEQLRALELRQSELQNTLLRISGAIQALADLRSAPPSRD